MPTASSKPGPAVATAAAPPSTEVADGAQLQQEHALAMPMLPPAAVPAAGSGSMVTGSCASASAGTSGSGAQSMRCAPIVAHMSKELRELLGRAREAAEGSAESSWPGPHAALPAALHLNGLRLRSPLPADFGQPCIPGQAGLAAFAAVTELSLDHNELTELPPLHMPCLAVLSLHDNDLRALPQLRHLARLASLRLDRNARLDALPSLPGSLRVLHLGGCSSLPGTYDDPASLPATVLELHAVLDDCMLPDDSMMGIFFGTPLPPPPPPPPAVASSAVTAVAMGLAHLPPELLRSVLRPLLLQDLRACAAGLETSSFGGAMAAAPLGMTGCRCCGAAGVCQKCSRLPCVCQRTPVDPGPPLPVDPGPPLPPPVFAPQVRAHVSHLARGSPIPPPRPCRPAPVSRSRSCSLAILFTVACAAGRTTSGRPRGGDTD